MATNLTEFSADLDEADRDVRGGIVELQVDLAVRFIEIAAELTPFLTGHAMANWVASVGSPDPEEQHDEPLTVREISERARAALRGVKFGDLVYAQNNADYISYLNDGSFSQAPAGFIEVALASAEQELSPRRI